MTTTMRRINATTAERITTYANITTRGFCDQCGMLCCFSDTPAMNHAMRSGDTVCYGCKWANVSLSGRKYAGISFADWADKYAHVCAVQGR